MELFQIFLQSLKTVLLNKYHLWRRSKQRAFQDIKGTKNILLKLYKVHFHMFIILLAFSQDMYSTSVIKLRQDKENALN